MKKYLLVFSLLLSSTAYADELLQMSNGMTCWRTESGHIYGCSGGIRQKHDSGFNDHEGRRYEYINENQAIDTRTGLPLNTPNRERYDNITDK